MFSSQNKKLSYARCVYWVKYLRITPCQSSKGSFVRIVLFLLLGLGFAPLSYAQAPHEPTSEMWERVNALESELRTLTAQYEKLQFRLDQAEVKIKELEKVKVAAVTPPAVAPAPAADLQPSVATPQVTTPAPIDPAALNLTSTELYNNAFTKLKQQDYQGAEAGFAAFVKNNPKDNLAGNAQYWLGETYYVRGDYTKAVEAFLFGYKTYPKNSKAPDSLLKLGLSLQALGSKPDACKAFKRFDKEYPDASVNMKDRVNTEMKKLGC
jgi:tol-pal system protein YbgF